MKKLLLMLTFALATLGASAKDIKTVVYNTTPQMSCHNCEQRIKDNLKFVKGVKKIETNLDQQTVTITFDADRTSEEKIKDAFQKMNYTVAPATEGGCQKGCCGGEGCANEKGKNKEKDDCCK